MEPITVAGKDIKIIQKHMLEILIKIDMIARDHDIKYILYGGTLLGCVRHKGFIPWDDDLDIALTRKEYKKLKKACQEELGPTYFWQDNETESEMLLDIAKVRDLRTIFKEEVSANLNIKHGIFIDVFPMDNCVPTFHHLQGLIVKILQQMKYRKLGLNRPINGRIQRFLEKKSAKLVIKWIPKRLLQFMINASTKLFNVFPTRTVCQMSHFGIDRPIIDKKLFSDVIEAEFEDYKFYIPKNYHQYLKEKYGNYLELPPQEERKPTHRIIECELQ